ncbi:MAG: calcium-translocating P-type ATPase, SERCA-type [Firmicutes bacterium]|nr:calcium-translocating P-type ATPase, SERCA-type [Bacillota bacterium]
MTAAKTADSLETDLQQGLTSSQAAKRLRQFGPNELKGDSGQSLFSLIAAQFQDVMVLILIGAAVVSILMGEVTDTIVILAIVVLNAVIGVVQANKAEDSLAALKEMSAPQAVVRRDGTTQKIPASELVPGDLIYLETGSGIPADARLVEAVNFRIDEAALTGESVPVEKTIEPLSSANTPLGDRTNMVFSGTTSVYGRGAALVTSTGMDTEIGQIASMIQAAPWEITPLQRKLDELGKSLGSIAFVLVVLVFLTGLLRGEPALDMLMIAISLAVAAIPEGLPAIVTIVLAVGVRRMSRRQAVVRRLPAVETLGTADIIASDKTGTLTQNEMTVTRIYVDNANFNVSGHGYNPAGGLIDQNANELEEPANYPHVGLLAHGFALANDAELSLAGTEYEIIGDPTEGALAVLGAKLGVSEDIKDHYPRLGELSFDSQRKLMTTFHHVGNGRLDNINSIQEPVISFTKGAPDVLAAKCTHIYTEGKIASFTEEEKQKLTAINSDMAKAGLRVLGLAFRQWEAVPKVLDNGTVESQLVFVGLAGMVDPPRPEVKAAVATAKRAGLRPIMITGDHKITATAIAEELGILENADQLVISGEELDTLGEDGLAAVIENVRVFARVSPEHKVQIVDALKGKGHIVAVTGDGVNDAPALKRADIGAAMGITGTDVAKEAADMVLADDNFATIVAAIAEGRTIYANIRKTVYYLLSCNVGEIVTIFMAIMLGWGRPLTAIQILWINLVTDGLPALALGMEPEEPGIMHRPPRGRTEGIFAGGMSYRIFLHGCLIGVLGLAAYYLSIKEGSSAAMAHTMTFATVAFSQLFHGFNARSNESLFTVGLFSNKYLVLAFAVSSVLQLAVLIVPVLQPIFGVVPLDTFHWSTIMGLSVVPLVIGELHKLGTRLKEAQGKTKV